MKVLVVEDYQDTADLMSVMLEHYGCVTKLASSGEQAIDVSKAWKPDVVLLDLGLPGIDGYEVARRMRREAELTGKIIALTGFAADDDKKLASGIDMHLVKPVRFDQLLKLVQPDLAANAGTSPIDNPDVNFYDATFATAGKSCQPQVR